MDKQVSVRKAIKSDLQSAIALSLKYSYKGTNNKDAGFITRPLNESDFDSLYIAEIEKVLVGIACASDLEEFDYEWYGIDKDSKKKIIKKITVDEEYRGYGIGTALIQHILNDYKDVAFYADIMDKPVDNIGSKKLFLKNDFNHIGTKPYYNELLKKDCDWAMYENKNEQSK